MVGMTDIAQFLAARLDEDEAAAVRAARPEPWVKPQPSRPDWYVQFWADERDRAAVVADPESSAYPIVATLGYDGNDEADEELAEGRVEHIARHDPARVLAEVAAKRRIVELHTSGSYRTYHCDNGDHIQEWQCERAKEPYTEHRYCEVCSHECVELPLLAAPYADHPDFDPSWRVPTTEENDHG